MKDLIYLVIILCLISYGAYTTNKDNTERLAFMIEVEENVDSNMNLMEKQRSLINDLNEVNKKQQAIIETQDETILHLEKKIKWLEDDMNELTKKYLEVVR